MFLRSKLREIAAARALASSRLADYAPIPPEFAAGVVAIVSGLLPVAGFPVLPDDGLWSLFDLDQGCLEHEIESFLERVAPSAPELTGNPAAPHPETVHELALLVYNHAKPYLTSNASSAA